MTPPAPGGPDSPEVAFVRQSWWLHDARWYQGVKERFGPEVANELNAAALKFVARRVAAGYAKENPGTRDLGPDEIARVLDHLARLMFSERMLKVRSSAADEDGVWDTVVTEHFALRMLRATRSVHTYECPCLDLRAGWFEGIGVAVDDKVVECMRTGDQVCRFRACAR